MFFWGGMFSKKRGQSGETRSEGGGGLGEAAGGREAEAILAQHAVRGRGEHPGRARRRGRQRRACGGCWFFLKKLHSVT